MMIEQVRSLLLEHNSVWFPDETPFRTLMYQYSSLINRLNKAVAPDPSKSAIDMYKHKVPKN